MPCNGGHLGLPIDTRNTHFVKDQMMPTATKYITEIAVHYLIYCRINQLDKQNKIRGQNSISYRKKSLKFH